MSEAQATTKKRGRPVKAQQVKSTLPELKQEFKDMLAGSVVTLETGVGTGVYAPVSASTELEPSASGILRRAAGIMDERGRQYDQPGGERSMGRAVAAFNIITGRDLQESEGWLLLQVLKDVRDRQRTEPHIDSLDDCVAYSALKAEARLAGK